MPRRRTLLILILFIFIGLLSALAGALAGLIKLPEPVTSHPLMTFLLAGLVLGGLGFWLYRAQSSDEKHPLRTQNRQRMLGRVRKRATKQLADSLQGATRLELGLHEQPNAVISFSFISLEHPDQPTQSLPTQKRISQAYEESEGQLLVLGEPGAGKTTLLLELVCDLLDRAQQDESVPMPILFSLTSWSSKRQPLGDWLVEELALTYQVPRKLGRSWIEADEIQPLLDGLDEVAQAQRSACVEAINDYRREHGLIPTIVSSRKDDYFQQPRRLLLQNAVVVQPLSQQQIGTLLSSGGDQLTGLCQALATDPRLQELALSPLMLNLMILAYQGLSVDDILEPSSLSTRQQQVIADYTQRRLQRRGPRRHYTTQKTKHWLHWLANVIDGYNLTAIYLERMQPGLLPDRPLWVYQCLAGTLPLWALGFLLIGLPLELTEFDAIAKRGIGPSLLWLMIVCIFAGVGSYFLVSGDVEFVFPDRYNPPTIRIGPNIRPAEIAGWSWKTLWKNWSQPLEQLLLLRIGALATLCIGALVLLLIHWLFGWPALDVGAVGGFALGGLGIIAFFGLLTGWSSDELELEKIVRPNQGIWRSARNGLPWGMLFGITFGLLLGASSEGLIGALVWGLDFCLFFWLLRGGVAFLRHFVLRFILWREDVMPWRYVRFLDYAAQCMLLRKVGGGYIFIHRLLQDYYATLETTEGSSGASDTKGAFNPSDSAQ